MHVDYDRIARRLAAVEAELEDMPNRDLPASEMADHVIRLHGERLELKSQLSGQQSPKPQPPLSQLRAGLFGAQQDN